MNELMQAIGPSTFLWPVAALGFLSVAIAVERFLYLIFRASLSANAFMASVQKLVMAGQIDQAMVLCLNAPEAPVANVVRAALLHADASREDLHLAVDQAAAEAVPAVQLRLGWLTTFANVATLFGLLGTIVGLMQSFEAVSHAEASQRQELLAGGISLAMQTTASGIAVAIPALLAYSFLAQRANGVLDDVERCGLKMEMLLLSRQQTLREGRSASPPAAAEAE